MNTGYNQYAQNNDNSDMIQRGSFLTDSHNINFIRPNTNKTSYEKPIKNYIPSNSVQDKDYGVFDLVNDPSVSKHFASPLMLRIQDYKNIIAGRFNTNDAFMKSITSRIQKDCFGVGILKKEFVADLDKLTNGA